MNKKSYNCFYWCLFFNFLWTFYEFQIHFRHRQGIERFTEFVNASYNIYLPGYYVVIMISRLILMQFDILFGKDWNNRKLMLQISCIFSLYWSHTYIYIFYEHILLHWRTVYELITENRYQLPMFVLHFCVINYQMSLSKIIWKLKIIMIMLYVHF